MLETGDLITLSNGKEYIVIEQVVYKNKNYVYLVSKDGISDVAIFLIDGDNLLTVDDELVLSSLLEKFRKEHSNG